MGAAKVTCCHVGRQGPSQADSNTGRQLQVLSGLAHGPAHQIRGALAAPSYHCLRAQPALSEGAALLTSNNFGRRRRQLAGGRPCRLEVPLGWQLLAALRRGLQVKDLVAALLPGLPRHQLGHLQPEVALPRGHLQLVRILEAVQLHLRPASGIRGCNRGCAWPLLPCAAASSSVPPAACLRGVRGRLSLHQCIGCEQRSFVWWLTSNSVDWTGTRKKKPPPVQLHAANLQLPQAAGAHQALALLQA